MTPGDREKLAGGARDLGVRLTAEQLDQFSAYAGLLEDWNRRLNLTRIPPEHYIDLHFLDSLAVARAVDLRDAGTLIDVGAGAGLPGIPLRIAFPHLRVSLLDSTRKRLVFLEAVIESLRLAHTATIHARAEAAGRSSEHREKYDTAVARAVAEMSLLAEWMLPLVRVGGAVIALKSAGSEAEVAGCVPIARALGGGLPDSTLIKLPGTDLERRIVVIPKRRTTPLEFPRDQSARASTRRRRNAR